MDVCVCVCIRNLWMQWNQGLIYTTNIHFHGIHQLDETTNVCSNTDNKFLSLYSSRFFFFAVVVLCPVVSIVGKFLVALGTPINMCVCVNDEKNSFPYDLNVIAKKWRRKKLKINKILHTVWHSSSMHMNLLVCVCVCIPCWKIITAKI